MKIKVTIKQGSKAAAAIKKQIAEKKAFKQAVANGTVTNHTFTIPIDISTPS